MTLRPHPPINHLRSPFSPPPLSRYKPAEAPDQPLTVWGYEASPFSKVSLPNSLHLSLSLSLSSPSPYQYLFDLVFVFSLPIPISTDNCRLPQIARVQRHLMPFILILF